MEHLSFETEQEADLTFARLSPVQPFEMDDLAEVDGVIIEYTDQTATLNLIKAIRSHSDKQVYLLPVFLYKFYRESNADIEKFCDGLINNLSDLSSIVDITNEIKERI